jgi:ABC-2 type transport system permease protein
MNEVAIVFSAEIMRKLRSRVFIVATLLGIFAIAALSYAPRMIEGMIRSSTDNIVLAGPAQLRERAATLMQERKDFRVIASVDHLPPYVTAKYLDGLHAAAGIAIAVEGGRLHLDIYPRDLAAFNDVQFRSLVPLNEELATGVPASRFAAASRIERSVHPIDAKFADAGSATFAHGIAFGLIFILYLAIIMGSQGMMAAVAEEKTSRIAEILVATISPVSLLTGKVLAAATLALAQVGIWLASGLLLSPLALSGLERNATSVAAVAAPTIQPTEIIAFVLFFLLGYLEFSIVNAAAASLVSRTEDLGSISAPLLMPVIGAFLIAQFAIVQPNAPWVVAFSFTPFISPFVMFTRIAVTAVPLWQMALAVGVNALTVAIAFYAAGKIYRVGMLLYGKLPSPKQIIATLRA